MRYVVISPPLFAVLSVWGGRYKLHAKLDRSGASMYVVLAFLRAMFRRNKLLKNLQCLLALMTPDSEEFYKAIRTAAEQLSKRKNKIHVRRNPTPEGFDICIRKGQLSLRIVPNMICGIDNAGFGLIEKVVQYLPSNLTTGKGSYSSSDELPRDFRVITEDGPLYDITRSWNGFYITEQKSDGTVTRLENRHSKNVGEVIDEIVSRLGIS